MCAIAACTPQKSQLIQIQTEDACYEVFQNKEGRDVSIGLIKHGSVCIGSEKTMIQIDPVADYGRHTDYSHFRPADVVLVTHEHLDHLDSAAIAACLDDTTIIICNKKSVIPSYMNRTMTADNNCTFNMRLHSGDSLHIEVVPAYNTTEGREQFHPQGNGNGYVIELDGLRVYVAGDTEDIPEMAKLKNIDVALLPVNQPYTMTPEQAIRAAMTIRPRILIPYHHGDTDLTPIAEALKDSGIEVRLRNMQ